MTTLNMNLGENSYPITVGKGLIEKANEYFNLNRKVFIITDTGVPNNYAKYIEKLCKTGIIYTVEQGESAKSFNVLEAVLTAMAEAELGRSDCVVAIGGGVVGDLAGFASSVYMRGVDFYNVPTTLLAQVDSSIGGKTAINLGVIKNTVGAFKQPKAVLIDVETLATLPKRHMRNGLAEVIKMAATSDSELFAKIENMTETDVYNNIEEIVVGALKIKKAVVESDEKENGIRKILNFGHTYGHAIESSESLSVLLHGECVALGMMPTSFGEAHSRIKNLLEKFGLPISYNGNIEAVIPFISHDKKVNDGKVSVVLCEKIGECSIKVFAIEEFIELIKNHI
jgi:3-dehydroquinate synthase